MAKRGGGGGEGEERRQRNGVMRLPRGDDGGKTVEEPVDAHQTAYTPTGRLGLVPIALMSWDEWVDVQMEARPMSGRANQASRTLFHGPRVALR
eukprot:scaffold12812_cov138-Isochrysis_galbana.AAC.4